MPKPLSSTARAWFLTENYAKVYINLRHGTRVTENAKDKSAIDIEKNGSWCN
jgi:hypothetical protein